MNKNETTTETWARSFFQSAAIATVERVARPEPKENVLEAYDQLCKASRFLDACESR